MSNPIPMADAVWEWLDVLEAWGIDASMESVVNEERVVEACKSLASVLEPVWNIGDGRGGWFFDQLSDALRAEGLLPPPVGAALDWKPRPRPKMLAVAERDGWSCDYCGCALGWGHPSMSMPTVDHKIPTSRGGTDELDNLVLACGPCNSSKNDKTAEEYLIWRVRRLMAERKVSIGRSIW